METCICLTLDTDRRLFWGRLKPLASNRSARVSWSSLTAVKLSISRIRQYAVMMFSTAKSRLWMKRIRYPIILTVSVTEFLNSSFLNDNGTDSVGTYLSLKKHQKFLAEFHR